MLKQTEQPKMVARVGLGVLYGGASDDFEFLYVKMNQPRLIGIHWF